MAIHYSIQDEEPGEQVYYNQYTGLPGKVSDGIRRSIGAYSRWGAFHRKVGITNDPIRRWVQAYRHNGSKSMIVVYESSLHTHVCELERMMTGRFFDNLMVTPGYYWNATGGGGGRQPHNGPYYLYFVLAPKFARITR